MSFPLISSRVGREVWKLTARALGAALLLAVLGPATAEAQARVPKQRTRITAADRKAAADARKVKMEEWKKGRAARSATPANGKGGAR